MCVSTWRAVQAEGKNRDVTIHGARESAGEAPGQVGRGGRMMAGNESEKNEVRYRYIHVRSGGTALTVHTIISIQFEEAEDRMARNR